MNQISEYMLLIYIKYVGTVCWQFSETVMGRCNSVIINKLNWKNNVMLTFWVHFIHQAAYIHAFIRSNAIIGISYVAWITYTALITDLYLLKKAYLPTQSYLFLIEHCRYKKLHFKNAAIFNFNISINKWEGEIKSR